MRIRSLIPRARPIATFADRTEMGFRRRAAILDAMRQWVFIFLLIAMPLQLSWAAASSYCRHETGSASMHLGHHPHQHEAQTAQTDQPDLAKAGGTDPDCGACHAGLVWALSAFWEMSAISPNRSITTPWPRERVSSAPTGRPERPQWSVFA